MINRIETDKELVREAACKLAYACDDAEYNEACKDMIKMLQYTQSVEWWKQCQSRAYKGNTWYHNEGEIK